ncbi:nucleotide sugar dehydrogenase [Nakamurella flava]|uniref:Nucleotide sugar dehydrogenase n=1 Tax=Nakamurella flava TaxID=2576308 RepID=A0A4U6QM47_9ACTN|nr:nucleotide sugar dehydrogenase [Nakamurella flava]TKV61717.1 nucleotide sugar dehydrogenase [Nakamurella flava]
MTAATHPTSSTASGFPPLPAVETVDAYGTGSAGDENPAFDHDVALVGLGYVGLPTALAFHTAGRRVLGLDVSERRLAVIASGEADLLDSDRLRLGTALQADDFRMTSDPRELSTAAAVIICVPTPVDAYLLPDLQILRSACETVVAAATPGQVIILTSTTYVGTTRELLVEPLTARGLVAGTDLFVAFSPERIDPGNDRHSHEDVPRVLGGVTPACADRAAAVLHGYARSVHVVPSPEAAEMTKLLENTFRAVNIALANEFAEICAAMDIPVMDVIRAAATKPYGFMPFFPGPGVGGHCIPCDPHYLLWQLRRERMTSPVIENAMMGIAGRPRRVVERIRATLSDNGRGLRGTRILVVGVAYKPDVQDLRESPALEIMNELLAEEAIVAYNDPLFANLSLPNGTALIGTDDPTSFAADLVLVHTRHRSVDLHWLADEPLVIDATYGLTGVPHAVTL